MYQPKKQFVQGAKSNRMGFAHQIDTKRVSVVLDTYNIHSGSHDDSLRKLDPDGNELWAVTNVGNNINDIAVTPEGDVFISHFPNVRKYDSTGTEITTGSWPLTFDNNPYGVSVDANGYVYVAEWTGPIYKFNPDGTQVWTATADSQGVYSVTSDINGNVYACGTDGNVRKYDSSGNEITTGSWPFTAHTGNARYLAVDTSGNVYSVSDFENKKIDSTGTEVWSIPTGGLSVVVDADGYTYIGDGNNDVRKIDSAGNQVWVNTFSGSNIRGVAVDPNGYVYAGNDSGRVLKIAPDNSEDWQFFVHSGQVNAVACAPGLYGSFPTEWE